MSRFFDKVYQMAVGLDVAGEGYESEAEFFDELANGLLHGTFDGEDLVDLFSHLSANLDLAYELAGLLLTDLREAGVLAEPVPPPPDVMPRVNGKSFRCTCGANVFRKLPDPPLRYRCNGCGAIYDAEPYEEVPDAEATGNAVATG